MTLQTTISGIDQNFPQAGVDNNSQGFRDNFSYIKTALETVDESLKTLETNSLSKGGSVSTIVTSSSGTELTVQSTVGFEIDMAVVFSDNFPNANGPIVRNKTYYVKSILPNSILVVTETKGTGTAVSVGTVTGIAIAVVGVAEGGIENNFLGSTLSNGFYNNFHGLSKITANVLNDAYINVDEASLHFLTIERNNLTFTLDNWPEKENAFAKVRLHFASDQNGSYSFNLSTAVPGNMIFQAGFPDQLEVISDGTHEVIDVWSFDGGNTVFAQYLGSLSESELSINRIDDIGDVVIANARHGDLLRYNSANQQWSNNVNLIEYNVTVAQPAGSNQNMFFLNNIKLTDTGLKFAVGKKYRFKLDNASTTHGNLRFSTTPDTDVPASITPYITNVIVVGTAGTSGSYVEIIVTDDTPSVLYLYANEGALDTTLVGASYPIFVGNRFFTGSSLVQDSETIAPGASVVYFEPSGIDNITLAEGIEGQIKTLIMSAAGGTMIVTVANAGWIGNTVKFNGVGQSCTLQYVNNRWHCIANNGATFNTYTVTYTAGSNGSITGTATQSVDYGKNTTLVTANPATGYVFSTWSDGVTTQSRIDYNVQGNLTVSAEFVPE